MAKNYLLRQFNVILIALFCILCRVGFLNVTHRIKHAVFSFDHLTLVLSVFRLNFTIFGVKLAILNWPNLLRFENTNEIHFDRLTCIDRHKLNTRKTPYPKKTCSNFCFVEKLIISFQGSYWYYKHCLNGKKVEKLEKRQQYFTSHDGFPNHCYQLQLHKEHVILHKLQLLTVIKMQHSSL